MTTQSMVAPARSIDSNRHMEVALYGDLPRFLRALSLMLGGVCFFAEGLMVLRFWSMVRGEIPVGGIEARLFDLSSLFLAPFRGFETVSATFERPVIEFSLLVALAAYFLIGSAVLLAGFELHRLADKYAPNPGVAHFDLASVVRGLWLADVTAENAWRRAEQAGSNACAFARQALQGSRPAPAKRLGQPQPHRPHNRLAWRH